MCSLEPCVIDELKLLNRLKLSSVIVMLPESISHDTLLPTLKPTMNVVESSKSHQVKKTCITKSVTFDKEPPVSKTDFFLSVSEKDSRRLNDSEPIKIAFQRTEEIHEIEGKHSDYSSRLFTKGSLGASEHTRTSKQNDITCLKPARKPTAPRFLSILSGAIVEANKDVKFEAIVESYPAADIVWCKNDSVLTNKSNKIRITLELNRAKLELFNVESEDAGRYTCSASNDVGSDSTSADLFVKKTVFPPVMGKRLHPQSITVGKRVMFEIEVTGTPRPSVTWFKNDVQLARTSPFYRQREQGNSHALIFEKVLLEDSGQYKVKAQNEAGEAVSQATLHVFEPPSSTITDENHKFSLPSNMEPMSNGAEPTSNLRKTFDYCKSNSNLTNGKFSQTVKVTKTDKRATFFDDQKVQDNFNTSIEKYVHCNDSKAIKYPKLRYTTSDAYENKSDTANSNSKEIEILQKPLVCTDLDTFQDYSSYGKSSTTYNNHHHIDLEPGPPPEMGYIPKESVPKGREGMADRVKKLESNQRQLSPVEIPPGAVKIFPMIRPKKKETENIHRNQYPSCIKKYNNTVQNHTSYENDEIFPSIPLIQHAPNIKIAHIENDRLNEVETRVPIYRPQAAVELRSLSPRPSAEGVSMERLWTHKKNIEQSSLHPNTTHSFSTLEKNFSFTSTPVSSFPSTEGVATEKLWSHVTEKYNRPHSIIGLPETSSVKTEESIKSENFQSANCGSESDAPKTETSQKYERIHEINDQVVSNNVLNLNVSDFDNKNYKSNRSYSEEKGVKNVGNKFQWPPKEEVSIRDNSLYRSNGLQNRLSVSATPGSVLESEKGYTAWGKSSYIQETEQVCVESQKSIRDETHSEPMSSTKVLNQNYDIIGNQTLPRSFKFTSSNNDSKFKPVEPFSQLAPKTTTPHSQPEPPSQSSFQTSSLTSEAQSLRTSEPFGGNTSACSKSVTIPRPRCSYTADTGDSWKNTISGTITSAEQNGTQITPKIVDDKISNIFSDNTKSGSSQLRSSSFSAVSSLSSMCDSKYEFRENVYNYRLPRSWHASDSPTPDKFYSYRPVRPNLPVQRPPYNKSSSAEVAIECNHSESSQCNFQPVPPLAQYSSAPMKFRPSPSVSSVKPAGTELVNDQRCTRSVSDEGNTARSPISETYQHQEWQKPTNYETIKDNVQCEPEITNLNDLKKIRKVRQIRKKIESDSALSKRVVSMVVPPTSCKAYEGITSASLTSSHKTISQQFIENVTHNVSNKRSELKETTLKSPSLGRSSVGNEHHLIEENYYNTDENEYSNNEFGWKSDLTRSTEANYVIVNGDGIPAQESGPDAVPVFSTPLHDIAAVSGSKAKFECIVKSESPFKAIWQKDGDVLQNCELCQINCRNGVCTLLLLKTYMYDAGTYHCIAMNKAGTAETSASLTVSNERRSYCNFVQQKTIS